MKTFDLNKAEEVTALKEHLNFLYEKKVRVRVSIVRKVRTFKQNRYLHLILSHFGMYTGYDLETVKRDFFKKAANRALFVRFREGKLGSYEYLRSTAELDTKEMTIAIERFRDFSSQEAGFYIPDPNETEYLESIEKQLENYENEKYL